MEDNISVTMQLTAQEQEMIDLLQDELQLSTPDEVLHLLVKQEAQRKAVVCPACGHYAAKTAGDAANCRSCLSVITLSEGIWEVVQIQKKA